MQTLTTHSLLQGGRYKIIETLGQGGFGITYLAIQSGLERKVAVKEFFMKELCERDESTSHITLGAEGSRETVNRFREKFLKEARNIARLNHPNIVRIIDVFEENGTAYYVMEYAENGSLADKVKHEGYLSEPVATRYILQVADALEYIHQQKMNHLDVKPANIMLNEKDESVLIDFGLSKQYDAVTGGQTSTTPVGISEGYAPMEQYMQGGVGEFTPETDIYALGATFYKLLTGMTPPNASFVNNEGLPTDELKAKGVSENTLAVICKAMEGRKKDRTKTVRTFIDDLNKNKASHNTKVVVEEVEVTLVTPETLRIEEEQKALAEAERKRKETEAKVAKEKAEARAKAEAERKARDDKERQALVEVYEHRVKEEEGKGKGIFLWIVGIVIGFIALAFYINNQVSKDNSVTISVGDVDYEMVKVEAGKFTMGTKIDEAYASDDLNDESPAHQVTLTSNYFIGKTEVTQALWKAVMDNNPSEFKGDNLPVENVSWDDCMQFVSKLNSMTGKNFRLPTEAEWEFAAHGGSEGTRYQYSGSPTIGNVAWFDENSGACTHIVGTKQPNELGIYDMSGNVREWCFDWYDNYDEYSQLNPTGPSNGCMRVCRGGSWADEAHDCRSTSRGDSAPHGDDYVEIEGHDFKDNYLGFRLVLFE